MILGSEALRPMIKALVPDAEIVNRPRFSTLSYAGARKLSRLPKRSAIVAFSAEEVYAVAEMLRRLRGGAAVVMGALSPRTRNAQVAMFQAGEVDYLVATDAIGMGLNMDVAHVAFASLNKFDGQRQRRLTVAEMAQIAGRAGRHQRDGTFGALVDGRARARSRPRKCWRSRSIAFRALDHPLLARGRARSRQHRRADRRAWRRGPRTACCAPRPQAIDLGVLKRLAEEDWVRDRARSPGDGRAAVGGVRRARFPQARRSIRTRASSSRVFGHLSEGDGPYPAPVVRRRDRAARRRRRRCRDDRRADRGGAHLGLYRAPRRLAGRPGALGGAHARRSRNGCPTRCTPA